MLIKKIGIIGLGLIGGSIAKTIKSKKQNISVTAFNVNQAPLIRAKEENAIDSFTSEIDESFSDCDIIFISTPVNTIFQMAQKLKPFIRKDCIITDVGSTKEKIFDEIAAIEDLNYIGGHPMAGSEKSGYQASKDYLFENAYYILCPMEKTKPESLALLKEFVENLDAIPVIVNPDDHDYAVAAISHVPHVLASALVNMVNSADKNGIMHTLAAGGFKDITRIASADPKMWASVSLENKAHILTLLDCLEKQIDSYKKQLEGQNHKNLENFFESAKLYRDTFAQKGSSGAFMQNYIIYVDVEDKPGSIATISTLLSVNNINIKNIGIINNREFENGVMQIILPTNEAMKNAVKLLEEMNFNVYSDRILK